MYCIQCGSAIPDDALFCTSCGARVESDNPPADPDDTRVVDPAPPQAVPVERPTDQAPGGTPQVQPDAAPASEPVPSSPVAPMPAVPIPSSSNERRSEAPVSAGGQTQRTAASSPVAAYAAAAPKPAAPSTSQYAKPQTPAPGSDATMAVPPQAMGSVPGKPRGSAPAPAAPSGERPADSKAAAPNNAGSIGGDPKKPNFKLIGGIAAAVVALAVGLLVFMFAGAGGGSIGEGTFSDSALQELVAKEFDFDSDGKISSEEAGKVTSIDLSGSDVSDLKGLEVFGSVEKLSLARCAFLSDVKIPALPQLTELDVSDSSVRSLDTSQCPKLATLNVSGSKIDSLDVTKMPELTSLDARDSSLTTLTLGGNTSIKSIEATGTSLSGIDFSGCTAIEQVDIDNSVQVKGLDSAGLTELWMPVAYEGAGHHALSDVAGGAGATNNDVSTYEYDDNSYIVARHYESTNNKGVLGVRDVSFETNDQGKTIHKTTVDPASGYKTEERTVKVTDTGMLEESTLVTYENGAEKSTALRTYTYDGDKVTKRDISTTSKGATTTTTYDYTYDGDLLMGATATKSGDEANPVTFVITYDDNKRVKTMEYTKMAAEFEYDADGNCTTVVMQSVKDGQKEPFCTTTMEYDSDGNCASAKREYTNGDVYDATCAYDHAGNLLERFIKMQNKDDSGYEKYEYARSFTRSQDQVASLTYVVGMPFSKYWLRDNPDFDALPNQCDAVRILAKHWGL